MTVLTGETLARLNAGVSGPRYDRRHVTTGIASAAACVRSPHTSDGIERAEACLAEAGRAGYRPVSRWRS